MGCRGWCAGCKVAAGGWRRLCSEVGWSEFTACREEPIIAASGVAEIGARDVDDPPVQADAEGVVIDAAESVGKAVDAFSFGGGTGRSGGFATDGGLDALAVFHQLVAGDTHLGGRFAVETFAGASDEVISFAGAIEGAVRGLYRADASGVVFVELRTGGALSRAILDAGPAPEIAVPQALLERVSGASELIFFAEIAVTFFIARAGLLAIGGVVQASQHVAVAVGELGVTGGHHRSVDESAGCVVENAREGLLETGGRAQAGLDELTAGEAAVEEVQLVGAFGCGEVGSGA